MMLPQYMNDDQQKHEDSSIENINTNEVQSGDDVEFEATNEDGTPSFGGSPQDKIKKLKDLLKESDRLKQEYLDGWQRLKADYVNLKKRSDEEKADIGRYVKESYVSDLIPVIESFDMAFSNKEAWEKVEPTWRIGMEYIHKQFMETLIGYGLSELNPVSEKFDPNVHTAIENISTDNKDLDHTIAEVIQKGYKVGDRLVKSPKVKVYVFNQ